MIPAVPSQVPPATPPDWDSITEDILCPLCEYNLRGVSEARCPECGYRFEWPEVLDPNRRLHRYLFEHHPERNVWSFRKTLTGQLLPRRFWRSLHPVQPVNPGRLRRYWLVVALVYFLCIGLITVAGIILEARDLLIYNTRQQARLLSSINPASPPARIPIRYGSYENFKAYVQTRFPAEVGWPLVQGALRQWSGRWTAFAWPLVALLWPWFTFGALLVFRWSMRQARIRPAHVLRCIVYSSDGLFWAGLVSAGLLLVATVLRPWPWAVALTFDAMVAFDVVIALHMLYRLVTAYWLYLRFDRPIMTILASQVIAGLAIANVVAPFTNG